MTRLRWRCVLLGGFFAELAMILIVIPLSLLAGEESLVYGAPAASFVTTFTFGSWAARRVPRRRVLHGTLVGVVAVAITLGMTRDLSIPYVVAHLLKVLGGAAGGFAASRRSNATDVPEVQRV